ncbi:MAG: thioredoxin family protein [Burkholderiaceae bacterium]|nr:thioredoxin family protein [Burkholderiaceae bacterium]
MKKLLGLLIAALAALFMSHAMAADLPYDESADAHAGISHALADAQSAHKEVLLVFGANWCKDCRELDKALHGKSAPLIDGKFVVIKVDVGNFDKNLDIAETYGNPIKKGIPAAVVLTADNKILYSTKGGELADARSMGENGIYDFFSKVVDKN